VDFRLRSCRPWRPSRSHELKLRNLNISEPSRHHHHPKSCFYAHQKVPAVWTDFLVLAVMVRPSFWSLWSIDLPNKTYVIRLSPSISLTLLPSTNKDSTSSNVLCNHLIHISWTLSAQVRSNFVVFEAICSCLLACRLLCHHNCILSCPNRRSLWFMCKRAVPTDWW
jgi:hypothetical protein